MGRLTVKLIKLISLFFLEAVIRWYQRNNRRLGLNNFSLKLIQQIYFWLILLLKVKCFLLSNKDEVKRFFSEIFSLFLFLLWKLRFFTIIWWSNCFNDDGIIFLVEFLFSSFLFKFRKFKIAEINWWLIFRKLKISFGKRIFRQIVNWWFLIKRIVVHAVLVLMMRFVLVLRDIVGNWLLWRWEKLWDMLFRVRRLTYKWVWPWIKFYLLIFNYGFLLTRILSGKI